MKKILILLAMSLTLALTACHQDNDDYMTQATIYLDGGDTLTINRVQAMVQITNLNTRHVVSTADFNGPQVQVELLRGVYQINVEGILSYTDKNGMQHMRSFRAITDYVELAGTGSCQAKLNIIFLD